MFVIYEYIQCISINVNMMYVVIHSIEDNFSFISGKLLKNRKISY